MNRYLKLVQMEVHRFRYILAGLMVITFLCQIGSMVWTLLSEISRREEAALRNEVIYNGSAFFPGDKLSFAWLIFNTQFWFIVPILLSIAVLVLYVFMIWYRDWFGGRTFIYRLLMLPTARRHIYLAKLTAIVLFVFSMISYQLLLLLAENMLFNLIVPSDMRVASPFSDAVSANQAFAVLLPHRFDDFIISYGLGIAALLLLFTAILLERSYRRIGILYAILYLAVSVVAIFSPMVVLGINNPASPLYPGEIVAIELGISAIVIVASVWLGFRLLAKKITV